MNVKMIDSAAMPALPVCRMTDEQLYNEINCFRAERLAKQMLENDLISPEQYSRIVSDYRSAYSPYLSEIT